MPRTGALAVALSSAALLGFTALAAAPAASAAGPGDGKPTGAPAHKATATADEGRGGDEMPYGVALRMLDDGSMPIVALTQDDIDDDSGDWHPAG
ncbi:hypothetical protein OG946_35905 [Streptomyces sp. NBC_01808]|uniref:hypothetical protein n=1 Tax=Streptomyces sp. NBC_01808 TaxID=2975947 RepID=UPI002DDC84B6|nr:hypothetical protein [Streptomyces sp. NBC_01808]WSA35913.1 hypothetical protein OG946_00085 [Streptomyces sp. NBC_01808]WSA42288.1 hypothetical protein OG946_35905 [Streptomyces sp. NBC_01808]